MSFRSLILLKHMHVTKNNTPLLINILLLVLLLYNTNYTKIGHSKITLLNAHVTWQTSYPKTGKVEIGLWMQNTTMYNVHVGRLHKVKPYFQCYFFLSLLSFFPFFGTPAHKASLTQILIRLEYHTDYEMPQAEIFF